MPRRRRQKRTEPRLTTPTLKRTYMPPCSEILGRTWVAIIELRCTSASTHETAAAGPESLGTARPHNGRGRQSSKRSRSWSQYRAGGLINRRLGERLTAHHR